MVFLEAFSAKTPVIAWDVPAGKINGASRIWILGRTVSIGWRFRSLSIKQSRKAGNDHPKAYDSQRTISIWIDDQRNYCILFRSEQIVNSSLDKRSTVK